MSSAGVNRKRLSYQWLWLVILSLLIMSSLAEFDPYYFDTRGWAEKMAYLDVESSSEWKRVTETPCFSPKEEPCRLVHRNVGKSETENGTIAVQMREPRFSELILLYDKLTELSQEGFIPELDSSKTYHHPSESWGVYFLKKFGETVPLVDYVNATKDERAIVQLAEDIVQILSRLAEIGIQHHDLSLYHGLVDEVRSNGNWLVRNGRAFLWNFGWAQDEIDSSTSRVPTFVSRPEECTSGCDDCVASNTFARLFKDSHPWIAQVFSTMVPPFCNAAQQSSLREAFAAAKAKNFVPPSDVSEKLPEKLDNDKVIVKKKKKRKKTKKPAADKDEIVAAKPVEQEQ